MMHNFLHLAFNEKKKTTTTEVSKRHQNNSVATDGKSLQMLSRFWKNRLRHLPVNQEGGDIEYWWQLTYRHKNFYDKFNLTKINFKINQNLFSLRWSFTPSLMLVLEISMSPAFLNVITCSFRTLLITAYRSQLVF